MSCSEIALSEITTMIEDKVISCGTSPIFTLKDLRKMYQEKIEDLGALDSAVKNVCVTRLKEAIINHVPGLCEQKSGKFVLLSLDGDIGLAISQFPISSSKGEGIILGTAAKITRKHLFANYTLFHGDIFKVKQPLSVPFLLLHLLALISDGATDYHKASVGTKKYLLTWPN